MRDLSFILHIYIYLWVSIVIMDNHFSEMLWGAEDRVQRSSGGLNADELDEFISSKTFTGSKAGYVFKNGARGVRNCNDICIIFLL